MPRDHQKPSTPPDQDPTAELCRYLEEIRNEPIPERLLELARELQRHLRAAEAAKK